MDFDLTDEQAEQKQRAAAFAQDKLLGNAALVDERGEIPNEIVSALVASGLLGIGFAHELGGKGGGRTAIVAAIEEIARACAATGWLLATHLMLFCRMLDRFADDTQKRSVLMPALTGESIGSVATIDETDIESLALAADRQESGGYLLRGETGPIACAALADMFLVLARDPALEAEGGLVALLVRRDAPGVSIKRARASSGLRGAQRGVLVLDGVLVAADRVLGANGAGLAIARALHAESRLALAAEALGVARAAFEKAAGKVREEQQRSKSAGLLGMQIDIADMSVEIDAARLLVFRAAGILDAGGAEGAEGAIASLFASQMATRAAHKAMLLHGAEGADIELGLERHVRDAHGVELSGERGDAYRTVIARSMLEG